MFKKYLSIILCILMFFSLAACGNASESKSEAADSASVKETEAPTETKAPEETEKPAPEETEAPSETEAPVKTEEEKDAEDMEVSGPLNFYVLAGPTGIGSMPLWASSDAGETELDYNITMTGANDEVIAALSTGDADIAAVATNLAATLYNKTQGEITVLAVNTLGVLSILSNGEELTDISGLNGRVIYAPGQGANPEYILRYVLKGSGLDPDTDVDIRFVGEGSELLSVWQSEPDALIMAPQPVATTLVMQNEGAKKLFDMTDEWDKVAGGESRLMMGCVVVRNDYLEGHKEEVDMFLEDYEASIAQAIEDVEGTAQLCEYYGLIPKAALAQKAIPQCGLTFIAGEEMKEGLSGYLQVMYSSDAKSVGGAMPAEDFYY